MTYKGRVQDGVVIFDGQKPREGILVDVHEAEPEITPPSQDVSPLTALLSIAGTVEGPADWSRNHDHYIHGTTKK